MLLIVCYTLPYDRSRVILSLSQVQNFLGHEGECRYLQTPETEGGTSPFWQPPDVLFGYGARRKSGHFFKQHFSNKNKCWGLNKAFFYHLRQQKKGSEKGVKRRVFWVIG
jgi:hypothetical protein